MEKRQISAIAARSLAVICGALLCLLLLELGLRLAKFTFLSLQEHRNKAAIHQKGVYRVMCLGESTTAFGGADSYPSQLQEILNRRADGIKFSVTNRGAPGMHTSDILDSLRSNLDAYHPDMVVTMMGAGDMGSYMPYEAVPGTKAGDFLRSLKVYKLIRIIWARGENNAKIKTAGKVNLKNDQACVDLGRSSRDLGKFSEAEALFKKAIELNPGNYRAYFELGWVYGHQGRYAEAEALFKKAIHVNPKNDKAYLELEWIYRDQGKFAESDAAFKKAAELNIQNYWPYVEQVKLSDSEALLKKVLGLYPESGRAYSELGWVYEHQGKFPEAEAAFKKNIGLNPKNYWPYVDIGRFYLGQGKYFEPEASFKKAEESFRKAIELNPVNYWPYIGLGQSCLEQARYSEAEALFKKAAGFDPRNYWPYVGLRQVYEKQGRYAAAEDVFKKAIEANPRQGWPYLELGLIFQAQGKRLEAEPLLKKAIELDPGNDRVYRTLRVLYIENGDPIRAREYESKANELTADYYPLIVIDNYRKLKAALDKRGIVYVCAQYPLRSIEPLKKIFQPGAQGIVFVDNEKLFKDALRKSGYKDYFIDMYNGDFGHCTPEGNRLLAENIANVILDEVFSAGRGINTVQNREKL
jgi:tetratricopeptide (TPR) repeat protein